MSQKRGQKKDFQEVQEANFIPLQCDRSEAKKKISEGDEDSVKLNSAKQKQNIQPNASASSSKNEDDSCKIIEPIIDIIEIKDSDKEVLEEPQSSRPSLTLKDDVIVLDYYNFDTMELNQKLDPSLQSKEYTASELLRNQIFIGNLPINMKKIHILKFYERFGKISDVKFIHSKSSKKAMCFLTFEHSDFAVAALETNGLLYCERNFCVSRVGRQPIQIESTILINNLPYGTTIQELYNAFKLCGMIRSQYLAPLKTNSRGLAYITFEFPVSAHYAVLLDNFKIKGRQVHVRKYTKQENGRTLKFNIVPAS